MLKGDLSATPFTAVITDLAASEALGCLHVEGPDGDEALVYFKNGLVYSTHLPGRRPQLGARLISSGALAPEALEEALEAQATELQGWRLGELLVHLGFVEQEVVEAFGIEQVHDACFEISRWSSGKWKFRKNEKTREDVAGLADVPSLLEETARREGEWNALADVIGGIASIPVLGAGGLANAEMALDQDEWALLCKVDGERNVHQLARDCGFTDFEAGRIVASLVSTGLLEIDGDEYDDADEVAEVDDVEDVEDEPIDARSAAARLMMAFGGGDQEATETDISGADLEQPEIEDADYFTGEQITEEDLGPEQEAGREAAYSSSLVVPLTESEQGWDDSEAGGSDSEISRLLSAREDEPVTVDAGGYTSYSPPAVSAAVIFDEQSYDGDPDALLPRYSVGFGRTSSFDESLSRVSDALSALLGAQSDAPVEESYTPELLDVSADDDEDERALRTRAAAAAELAAAHAEMEEQRRRFDEARRKAEEESRLEAEKAQREAEEAAAREAERIAAEEEAARVAAEEAARVAAEEEAARLAAEEAARLAAEEEAARLAAEEAERLAAEAEAARIAAEETARVAAEEEAARLAAEEEAARVAAEEEAARLAAEEEAARVAAEEDAVRVAAEEEAARVAAEEGAVRVAAEEDAARLAADEAARVAAEEEEAARLAAEDEAARAAVEEAARLAEEAGRLAAEEEAARIAQEEASRVAAEQAAAAAALLAQMEQNALPEEPPAPAQPPAPPAAPAAAPAMTDTASLMRELSSLGFDDEPAAPAPTRPSAPVGAAARGTAQQADKGKKRKGLFGRG